jgi:sec-independent protein translocase protein TatA
MLAFFSPGPMEIAVIGIVMLLLFGNRLPSVMGSIGRSVVEFKKGVNDIKEPLEEGQKSVKETIKKAEKELKE